MKLEDLGPNPPEYKDEETEECYFCGGVFVHSMLYELEPSFPDFITGELICPDCKEKP